MSFRCIKCLATFTRQRNLTLHEPACTKQVDYEEEILYLISLLNNDQSDSVYNKFTNIRLKNKQTIKMQRKSDTPPVKNESQVNWFVKTTNVFADKTTTGPIKAMTTSTPGYTGISQPIPAEAEAFMNSDNNAPFPAIKPPQTQPKVHEPTEKEKEDWKKYKETWDLRSFLIPTKANNYLKDPIYLKDVIKN